MASPVTIAEKNLKPASAKDIIVTGYDKLKDEATLDRGLEAGVHLVPKSGPLLTGINRS